MVTPSLKRHGFPAIPDITWADVGGLHEAKKCLRDSIIIPMKRPEYGASYGLRLNSGSVCSCIESYEIKLICFL